MELMTDLVNEFVGKPTVEVGTVVCEADSGSSLAGKSWKFTVTDGIDDYTFQPYYVVDGVGDDPTLGAAESDAITFRADAAGDLAAKYFTINDGLSTDEVAYYVYFNVEDTAGYQELGLTGKSGSGNTGLSQSTAYSIKVTVDQRDQVNYTITTPAATVTYTILLALLNAAILRTTWSIVGGDVRCTSNYTGAGSAIALAAGTSSDLLAALSSTPDTAATRKTSYDPKIGQNEISAVTLPADTAGSLNGTYWLLYSGTTKYKVWYWVEGETESEPTVSDSTPIAVVIPSGAPASLVAKLTAAAINAERTSTFSVEHYGGAKIKVTILAVGATTDAANGDTGVTVSVLQAGVAAAGALTAATLLCAPDISVGDADEVVAAAFVTAAAAVGWTGVARAASNDHIVDLVHASVGNCTNTADGNVGGAFAVTPTAGVDPTSGTVTSIAVAIDEDDTNAAVAIATKAAIEAVSGMGLRLGVGISTATLTLTNRRGGVVTDVADVDTSWSTITNATQGSAVVTYNMGQDVASANYMYKPPEGQVLRVNALVIALSDDDVTDAAKFGNITALTNGCNINICATDGTVLKKLAGPITTNLDLQNLGVASIQSGTNDSMVVQWPIAYLFGEPVLVDGSRGEYIEMDVNDNLNGVALYMSVQGWLEDALA